MSVHILPREKSDMSSGSPVKKTCYKFTDAQKKNANRSCSLIIYQNKKSCIRNYTEISIRLNHMFSLKRCLMI